QRLLRRRARPRNAALLPHARLRRLVGRGPGLTDLQPVPPRVALRNIAHFAAIRYNASPAVPGQGSAIFIHVDVGRPTNGCVSLRPHDLVELLRLLRPAEAPEVAIRLQVA